jgi:hypothetical protein
MGNTFMHKKSGPKSGSMPNEPKRQQSSNASEYWTKNLMNHVLKSDRKRSGESSLATTEKLTMVNKGFSDQCRIRRKTKNLSLDLIPQIFNELIALVTLYNSYDITAVTPKDLDAHKKTLKDIIAIIRVRKGDDCFSAASTLVSLENEVIIELKKVESLLSLKEILINIFKYQSQLSSKTNFKSEWPKKDPELFWAENEFAEKFRKMHFSKLLKNPSLIKEKVEFLCMIIYLIDRDDGSFNLDSSVMDDLIIKSDDFGKTYKFGMCLAG